MPKDRVYQLRFTSEEKQRLARIAHGRELSIAQMIRSDYGLEGETRPERVMVKARYSGGQILDASPAEIEQAQNMSKRFKQIVAQEIGKGKSQAEAEEIARKRA